MISVSSLDDIFYFNIFQAPFFMSTVNRIIKNTGFLYAKMGITMFISLYTTRLILNSLGASDFGIFNIVGGAIAMLGFLNAAMAGATQRFMSYSEGEGDREKQKSIFNISIILHSAIAVIVGLLLLVAGYFFFNGILNIPTGRVDAAKVVYGSLIVSTMFTVMNVPYDAVMNAHENMKYYAIVGIFESLLKLVVAFVCVYTVADKLIVYGALMAAIPLVTLTIMKIYCHRHYEECIIQPRLYFNKALMREMTGFAGWNLCGTTIIMVSSYGQGIILNHFFGTLLNAAQGIASQLNGQMQALSSNMLKALNPIQSKSVGAHNNALLIKSTVFGAKYSALIYLIVVSPIFVYAPYCMELWLKNVPDWCIIFVRLQIIRSFIEMQFTTVPSCVMATGKIKYYTICSTLSNVLQLPVIYTCFYVGMPPYMLYVVGIVFGNVFVYFFALLFTKKYVGLSPLSFLVKVSLPLWSLAISVCLLLLVFNKYCIDVQSLVGIITAYVISTVAICTLFWLLFMECDEKKIVGSVIDKVKIF